MKNDENVASKSNKKKKLCKKVSFLAVSISHRHGSADLDPDPPQNVMDPQH